MTKTLFFIISALQRTKFFLTTGISIFLQKLKAPQNFRVMVFIRVVLRSAFLKTTQSSSDLIGIKKKMA